jgi:high-affinity nickel-transport protein
MVTLLAVILLGFFLGMRHATDPDHVIAVTTIVSRQQTVRHAAMIGVLWGIGHTLTIFLVGAAIIIFNVVIPPRIGLTMELSVGLMLVLLGGLNLTGIMRWLTEIFTSADRVGADVHSHPHSHGEIVHTHPHSHGTRRAHHAEGHVHPGWLERTFGQLGVYHALRPLVVGIVHGLAGSAAVALLVLATIRNAKWAVAYLLVFGIGTIAGMMLITAAISLPFTLTGKRFAGANRLLGLASGAVSLGFGLLIAYQIGFVDGLFTNHPIWRPR